jgi:hypothetical protein
MKHLVLILLLLWSSSSFSQNKKVKIYTDERVELLNVIQYLGGYPVLNQSENLQYKKDIDSFFYKFKGHDAVTLNADVAGKFLNFDRAVNFILHYSLPDFKQSVPFTDSELEKLHISNANDTLALIAEKFKSFYKETNFRKFYKSHKKLYNNMRRPVAKELSKYNIPKIFADYYGEGQKVSYNIILAPMLHDGGFASDIVLKKKHNFFAIVGPTYDSISSQPQFDTKTIFSDYVIHEFSHNFCNPVIDNNWSELSKLDCIFTQVAKDMKRQGYGSWRSCCNEYLVRANEIVLNRKIFGDEKASELMNDFIQNRKFVILKEIVPAIENEYLSDRKKYSTLEEFFPRILGLFRERAKDCN